MCFTTNFLLKLIGNSRETGFKLYEKKVFLQSVVFGAKVFVEKLIFVKKKKSERVNTVNPEQSCQDNSFQKYLRSQ